VIEGAEAFGHGRTPGSRSGARAARTRNLEIPAFDASHRPGMTVHQDVDGRGKPGHDENNESQIFFAIATAVSAMRLEQPHSLSYQLITRTSVPFSTLVWSMWKVDECGSWLKSIETLGAVV